MLYPGDFVSSAEEYLPGFGVYSTEDSLYSSNIGDLDIDKRNHIAKLRFRTKIPKMQGVGTVTLGVVAEIMGSLAIVDLMPFNSEKFNLIPHGISAILHISEVKMGYADKMENFIRIGDILRVKITDISKDTVRLSIVDKNLGVIKAYCMSCRHELEGGGRILTCKNCGAKQARKTALDYGSGKVL